MNYFFTTLAVGEPYFTKSLEFYKQLHDNTEQGLFNVTTSTADLATFEEKTGKSLEEFLLEHPRLQITEIEKLYPRITFPYHMEGYGFTFNLNLKVVSLKACLLSGKPFDYIIFADGDWSMHTEFSERKLLTFFETMENMDVDFAFERPAMIGNYKKDGLVDCFFEEKLRDYNVLEHDVYDNAHVVNEQFLGFRNNPKFRLFVQKWEQMLWYSVANNIRNYPDGFEIGVAALESKMNWNWYLFGTMPACFYFYAKYTDTKYIKF